MKKGTRGLGHIYRRGRVYWVKYSSMGTCCRESSRSTDRRDAVKLLKDRLVAIAAGRLIMPQDVETTFEDMYGLIEQDYRLRGRKSWRRVETNSHHLRPFFGRLSAREINYARGRQYIAHRLAEGASLGTISREMAVVKRMLSLAATEGRITAVPKLPTIPLQKARVGFFETGQLEALLQRLGDKYAAMTRFAAITGWRKEECRLLTWRQVDFAAGELRLEVGTTKNGKGRIFPFAASPALAALLREQREMTTRVEREQGRIVPWVFHRRGVPVGVNWLSTSKTCACVAALHLTVATSRLIYSQTRSMASTGFAGWGPSGDSAGG